MSPRLIVSPGVVETGDVISPLVTRCSRRESGALRHPVRTADRLQRGRARSRLQWGLCPKGVPARPARTGVTITRAWVVEIGVGRLNKFLGTLNLVDKTWCCERCQAAAHAINHSSGDRYADHYPRARQDARIVRGAPRVIERRG